MKRPLLPSHYAVWFEPPDEAGDEVLHIVSERRTLKLKGFEFREFYERVVPLLDGSRSLEEIQASTADVFRPEDLEESLALLEAQGVLVDATADSLPAEAVERMTPQLTLFRDLAPERDLQAVLATSTVALIGLGGAGPTAALALAAAAVGTVRCHDALPVAAADVYYTPALGVEAVGTSRAARVGDLVRRAAPQLEAVASDHPARERGRHPPRDRRSGLRRLLLDAAQANATIKLNRVCLADGIPWISCAWRAPRSSSARPSSPGAAPATSAPHARRRVRRQPGGGVRPRAVPGSAPEGRQRAAGEPSVRRGDRRQPFGLRGRQGAHRARRAIARRPDPHRGAHRPGDRAPHRAAQARLSGVPAARGSRRWRLSPGATSSRAASASSAACDRSRAAPRSPSRHTCGRRCSRTSTSAPSRAPSGGRPGRAGASTRRRRQPWARRWSATASTTGIRGGPSSHRWAGSRCARSRPPSACSTTSASTGGRAGSTRRGTRRPTSRGSRGSGSRTTTPVALPAGLVHLIFPPPRLEDLLARATSNGLAAGSSLEAAVLSGLCEAMERDALMIAWINRLPAVELDLADPGAGVAAALRRHYALLGVQLRAFLLPTDLPAAVVLAVAFDERPGRPASVVGAGCHPAPAVALTKAVFEL